MKYGKGKSYCYIADEAPDYKPKGTIYWSYYRFRENFAFGPCEQNCENEGLMMILPHSFVSTIIS